MKLQPVNEQNCPRYFKARAKTCNERTFKAREEEVRRVLNRSGDDWHSYEIRDGYISKILLGKISIGS